MFCRENDKANQFGVAHHISHQPTEIVFDSHLNSVIPAFPIPNYQGRSCDYWQMLDTFLML
jgi:hypothetical protein